MQPQLAAFPFPYTFRVVQTCPTHASTDASTWPNFDLNLQDQISKIWNLLKLRSSWGTLTRKWGFWIGLLRPIQHPNFYPNSGQFWWKVVAELGSKLGSSWNTSWHWVGHVWTTLLKPLIGPFKVLLICYFLVTYWLTYFATYFIRKTISRAISGGFENNELDWSLFLFAPLFVHLSVHLLYPPVHSSPPVIRQVLVRSHQSPSHFQSPICHLDWQLTKTRVRFQAPLGRAGRCDITKIPPQDISSWKWPEHL